MTKAALRLFFMLLLCAASPAAASPSRFAVFSLEGTRGETVVHLTADGRFEPSSSEPAALVQAPLLPAVHDLSNVPRETPAITRRAFWISRRSAYDEEAGKIPYEQVETGLAGRSQHADFWIDRRIAANFSDRAIGKMLDIAENAAAALEPYFGSVGYAGIDVSNRQADYCDAKGSVTGKGPKYLPSPGNFASYVVVAPTRHVAAGTSFLNDESYSPQTVLDCKKDVRRRSNELPGTIVLVMQDEREIDGHMASAVPHELQHALLMVRRQVSANVPEQSTFIDEGLSMLATDIAMQRFLPEAGPIDLAQSAAAAREFLAAPGNFSLLAWRGRDRWQTQVLTDAWGCYGLAYLLQRYLYDRFGDSYLNAVTASSRTGPQAIEEAAHMPFTQVMRDFASALMNASWNGGGGDAPFFRLVRGELRDTSGQPYAMPKLALQRFRGAPRVLKGSLTFFESDVPAVRADRTAPVLVVPAP